MILLVPLSQFRIDYEIGSGRPYSDLDTLILRAIGEAEVTTIEVLQNIFGLPSRLLIEILVTLFKEGWIAINAQTGGGFDITPQGRAALESDKATPEMRHVEPRTGFVMMERLTGMLIPQSEIVSESKRVLEKKSIWERAYRMRAEFTENNIDEGQVQYLLRRDKAEWIRRIGTPVMTSKDWFWLHVEVDLDHRSIHGLPERWVQHLESLILEDADEIASRMPNLAQNSYWGNNAPPIMNREEGAIDAWGTTVTTQDLLLTSQQHVELLKAAFEETTSMILVASAFIDSNCLNPDLRAWFLRALERGVHIDLLWGDVLGQTEHERAENSQWLANLHDESRQLGLKGSLRFNETPTDSHAKLLIHDTSTGFKAYVGSYDWLSTPPKALDDEAAIHITIGLRHAGLVAELCRSVAAFMITGQGNHLSASPDRWRGVAEQLDQKARELATTSNDNESDNPDFCTVQVIRDQKHMSLLSECLVSAQSRCAVLSRKIDDVAVRRLAALKKRDDNLQHIALSIQHGKLPNITPENHAALKHMIQAAHGTLIERANLQARAIVADTSVLVSSYNFLSGNPFDKLTRAREVGLFIEGGKISEEVWKVIEPSVSSNR
jgi:hypothetical protein